MQNNLKKLRRQRKLTQWQLAELSGVPRSTISEIEMGTRCPGVDIALYLAQALGCTAEDIFLTSKCRKMGK